jgi:hypothetical protein
LTSEGTSDWAHWGLNSAGGFDYKKGVTRQISDFKPFNNANPLNYTSGESFSWTDGAPTAVASGTKSGVYVIGQDRGFEITVPADKTSKTLKLYVGVAEAGGKLEAILSDKSASTLVDTSVLNASGSTNRVYTINYRAGSSGQKLTVRWTVDSVFGKWGNITLQSATLAGTSSAEPNQAPVINAGGDQTISLPNSASLNGTATDDGLPNPPALTANWKKISGPGTVSFADAGSLNTKADFSLSGVYVLRLTVSDGALTTTDDITVTVNNPVAQGYITAAAKASPSNVNLTQEGILDWAHWGLYSAGAFNYKNNYNRLITDYTAIGTSSASAFADNTVLFDWYDGAPAGSESTRSGIYIIGEQRGFEINVPADTNLKTLKLYVGVYAGQGKLEAILSDGSAPVLIDTSVENQTELSNVVYTLKYKAATPGQKLTIRWTMNSTYHQWGNVTLQAASLF